MNLLIGKKEPWGISCEEIGFRFSDKKEWEHDEKLDNMISDWVFLDGIKILGVYASAYPVKTNCEDNCDIKLAVVGPEDFEHDIKIIIGNLRTMAADLNNIRRSKKPVIAICDFDFLDAEQV